MNWLMQLFTRHRRYDELSQSIRQHLEEKVADLMDRGMTGKEAERTAPQEFVNVTLIEERSRESWQWPVVESLLVDVKLSLRRFRNSPGFTMTVILTLAIGIGANTAVFSVVNGVLIKPLAYPEPEQLVALNLNAPGAPGLANFRDGLRLSASMYLTFATHNHTFQSVGVWEPATANVTGVAQPEQVNTALVSDGGSRPSPFRRRPADGSTQATRIPGAPSASCLALATGSGASAATARSWGGRSNSIRSRVRS